MTDCKQCSCKKCKFKGDCHCPLKRGEVAPSICSNFTEKPITKKA